MESRFDGRIIVVGHLMAGKTTLINSLLLQNFDMSKAQSTNGVVSIQKSAVLLKSGDWMPIDNPTDSEQILARMRRAHSQEPQESDPEQQEIKLATEINYQIQFSEMKLRSDENEPRKRAFQSTVPKEEKMSDSEPERDENITCRLHFMDFAGQSIFNSTHQMFMSRRAVYLLVFDISRELLSEVEDDDVYCIGANRRMSCADFIEFLLRSIDVYSGDQTESFPKVLLVGTHKDEVAEVLAIQRMETAKDKFKDTPLQKLIRGDFIVDCSIQNDPEIDRLRASIFEIVQKEPYWGEKTPTRWLPLENCIINRRNRGERVLTVQTIEEINKKECYVKLRSIDEIENFLRFHNAVGNVIYFGGKAPDVIIILDPQWLIDALKQIITHEQFYRIPEGLDASWKEFIHCAKLYRELIEAVWSGNEDKTFITHMKQLLIIFELTDIIASPLTYSADGYAKIVDFYFVPSMLKPNQEGHDIVVALLKHCRTKSPPMCFVFDSGFMQPAIFPRIQAECTSIYKIKEVQGKPLLFYQAAVFQLNQKLDLVIEHVGHVIRVTVMNENEDEINAEVCENVRLALENALTDIVRMYGNAVPFYKALQCKEASTNIKELFTWHKLANSDNVMCKAHIPAKFHRISTRDAIGPWLTRKVSSRRKKRPNTRGIKTSHRLQYIHLARISRRLLPSELIVAARTRISEVDWQQSRHDNKDHIVGEVYDVLTKWSKDEGGLSLNIINSALRDSQSHITFDQLNEAVADTDTSLYLKDFDEAFLKTTVNDEAMDLISQRSAKMYKHLALELGIDHHVVESVAQDVTGVTHRAKQLLRKWKRCSPATYREIGSAIIEVDMDFLLLAECRQLMEVERIYEI